MTDETQLAAETVATTDLPSNGAAEGGTVIPEMPAQQADTPAADMGSNPADQSPAAAQTVEDDAVQIDTTDAAASPARYQTDTALDSNGGVVTSTALVIN